MDSVGTIVIILPSVGVGILLALGFIVTHAKEADQLYVLLCRVAHGLFCCCQSLRQWVERHQVAAEIQAFISVHGGGLDRQAPGVLPFPARIEWVNAAEAEAILQHGEVVVRLRRLSNQAQNIVNATLLYLSEGLLPKARRYLDKTLRTATDFIAAKSILDSSREYGAAGYFVQYVLQPTLEKSGELTGITRALDTLNSAGYFSRVYLNEIRELGERLLPSLPTRPQTSQEIRSFIEFLVDIAERETERTGALDFRGGHFSVSFLLVARRGKVEEKGLAPYLRRLNRFVGAGTVGIYIAARGDHNVEIVHRLLKEVRQSGMLTVLLSQPCDVLSRQGTPTAAIVVVCTTNTEYMQRRQRAIQPVVDALTQTIPEIEEGIWRILRTERRVGYGSKIAIDIPGELDVEGAIRQVLAREGTLENLRSSLHQEAIHLVAWNPSPEDFVVSALDPSHRSDIVEVSIDQADVTARISVRSDHERGVLIGKDGWNVHTAADLTGWEIEIEIADVRKTVTDPDLGELVCVLLEEIPEMKKGDIRMEGIARERGIGSKVVVRANSAHIVGLPSAKCIGKGNSRLNAIRTRLPGEWINFIDWTDDSRELIRRALFPLQRRKIVEIQLDEVSREAIVRVPDEGSASKAVGNNLINLQLAEAATGWKIIVTTPSGREHSTDAISPGDRAIEALTQLVPEISNGEIQIHRIVFEPGIGAKIAVRMAVERIEGTGNPVSICLGTNKSNLPAIRRELQVSFVSFVEWGSDEEANLVSALYPLQRQEVLRVSVDKATHKALIEVKGESAYNTAVGHNGGNLRLAEKLTGYSIDMVSRR